MPGGSRALSAVLVEFDPSLARATISPNLSRANGHFVTAGRSVPWLPLASLGWWRKASDAILFAVDLIELDGEDCRPIPLREAQGPAARLRAVGDRT